MSPNVDLSALSASLSPSATVTVPDANFASTYANWTDYNLQMPLAVVKPTSEADILAAIRFAAANSLRVSARGGGHSPFNTVEGGIVVDLASYAAVTYDGASQTITVQAGAKNGDVLPVLAKNNRCACTLPPRFFLFFFCRVVCVNVWCVCAVTGSTNGVGFVPLVIAGGFGPLLPKVGMGIDNIISARLLLSTGEALTASRTENPDIFEVICGAGQALGIVSELTVATYPLAETVGSADGTVWSATIAYPADRAADVANMLENLKVTPEMIMYMLVALPPPETGMPLTAPMIIFLIGYFGSDAQADAAWADLDALGPALRVAQRVPYAQMNDRNEPFQQPGGFKRIFGVGLNKVSAPALTELTQQVAAFVNSGPDFFRTAVLFEMLGVEKLKASTVGIYPHRDVKYWW